MKNRLRRRGFYATIALLFTPCSITLGSLDFGSNNFGSAPNFTGSNGISQVTNIESFSAESNEPGHRPNGANGAGRTAWWRWTAPENGFVSMDTLVAIDSQTENPVLNTVLAVYTGTSLGNLQRVTANDDHSLIRTAFYYSLSNLAFYAIKGTTYRIAVDGHSSSAVNSGSRMVQLRLRHLSARPLTRRTVWGASSDPGLRGTLSLTQTINNAFTATLIMGRRTVRFRGVFDIEGYFRTAFDRPTPRGTPPLPPLQIEIDGVAGILRTYDSLETRTYVELPEVITFSSSEPNPVAGYFTAGSGNTGYLTATIAASGLARGAVRAPDGSAFTYSARLTRGILPGEFFLPLFRMLRNGTGFWSIHTRIVDAGVNDDWYHFGSGNRFVRAPAPGATYFPNGINQTLALSGGTYIRPASGQRALGFLNASSGAANFILAATPGELANDVTQQLTFDTNNRFLFSPPTLRPTLSFNPRTGLATGGITLAGEPRRTLRGILRRNQTFTFFSGYATGRTSTVRMNVLPP